MKKLTRQEKHEQCIREIRGTLVVVAICCVWHISSAFLLNGTGLYFLGMPAWFSVSTLGTIVLSLLGVWYLLKKVFIDFEYEDEEEGGRGIMSANQKIILTIFVIYLALNAITVLYLVSVREVSRTYHLKRSFLSAEEI